ncbi:ESX secretion-associated protein EspG [Saccharopolyspora sp. K220]|uniref:ESX secretion-associated protein EspG n=1 Tax=Saccharopolyspora soli TaxID=2926618 RepID=UPI001F5A93BB|nr:ESX secretion-associated protein EspG [Saccharopolyspora soli]MCI2415797.1 ESX secretion-associated protein EspG [Saccharopolyspora soli]
MTRKPDFTLSATEFDLLYSGLGGGQVPFPLDVPSVGATVEERARLTEEMYRNLANRGLAVGNRLDADLADLLRLLVEPEISVDAVGYLERPLRALAASSRRAAVLAEMVGDQLLLTGIRPTALASSIIDVLPENEPGPARAMSIPQQPLARVLDQDDDFNDDPFGGDIDDETALIRAGLPAKDAAALLEFAGTRVAGGQFGVSRGSHRASTLVTWFDTPQGRYLMVSEDSWLSVAPAGQQRIADRVAAVLSTVEDYAHR